MPIGYIQISVGIAGPLLLIGREYFVSMATTEGCLVASTNRGCKSIYASGGATSVLFRDGMTRAPVVRFGSAKRAAELKFFVEDPMNFEMLSVVYKSVVYMLAQLVAALHIDNKWYQMLLDLLKSPEVRGWKSMKKIIRGDQVSYSSGTRRKKLMKKQRLLDIRKAILTEAENVVATLSGCSGDLYGVCAASVSGQRFSILFEGVLFDAVVIDEVSQALEPVSLVPLQLLKSKGTICVVKDAGYLCEDVFIKEKDKEDKN